MTAGRWIFLSDEERELLRRTQGAGPTFNALRSLADREGLSEEEADALLDSYVIQEYHDDERWPALERAWAKLRSPGGPE